MMPASASTSQDSSVIRRIRSTGDLPRQPDPAHTIPGSRRSTFISTPGEGLEANTADDSDRILSGMGRQRAQQANPSTPRPNTIPVQNAPLPPAQFMQQTGPLYRRVMAYFGLGRTATPLRKSQASLIWNLLWGFSQLVIITTVLALTGTRFKSPTHPAMTEWVACDRPLGVWACLWLVRMVLASMLSYWEYTRDRQSIRNRTAGTEAGVERPSTAGNAPLGRPLQGGQTDLEMMHENVHGESPSDSHRLPHTHLYSRLTLLSSLLTLSWFLTAHILEYTSLNTCRHSSPHLWWLIFGILCIMYIMVLEVMVLGFVVLIVAPIVFVFWNIFLICLGRHPVQNAGPEVRKLPRSIVNRIPLVMYIPAPPENAGEKSTSMPAVPEAAHSYPPKKAEAPENIDRKRFKFLRRISRAGKNGSGDGKYGEGGTEKNGDKGAEDGETWEANWERGDYPFVVLEGNRAVCAICLMDFEEPKRVRIALEGIPEAGGGEGGGERGQGGGENIREEQRTGEMHLEDAGEGAQPLRLLQCGHVFHKTCVDPWLIDVSGRCPVCQQAVTLTQEGNKSRRGRRRRGEDART